KVASGAQRAGMSAGFVRRVTAGSERAMRGARFGSRAGGLGVLVLMSIGSGACWRHGEAARSRADLGKTGLSAGEEWRPRQSQAILDLEVNRTPTKEDADGEVYRSGRACGKYDGGGDQREGQAARQPGGRDQRPRADHVPAADPWAK